MGMLTEINVTKTLSEAKIHNIIERQDSAIARAGFTGNKPVKLEKGPLRFVITDSPMKRDMIEYTQTLTKLGVKHVCRAAELNYSTAPLGNAGIFVHEMSYNDGGPPPKAVLDKWLNFVEDCFIKFSTSKNQKRPITVKPLTDIESVAVQCVAGLGRGPLLVAVALVEYCKLSPKDAVEFIRKERRGAINKEQIKWLEEYSPTRYQNIPACHCIIC